MTWSPEEAAGSERLLSPKGRPIHSGSKSSRKEDLGFDQGSLFDSQCWIKNGLWVLLPYKGFAGKKNTCPAFYLQFPANVRLLSEAESDTGPMHKARLSSKMMAS
jgi:hypothetical protein